MSLLLSRVLRSARSARGATLVALMLGTSGAWAASVTPSAFSVNAGGIAIRNSPIPVSVSNFNPSRGTLDAQARAGASVGADALADTQGTGPFSVNQSSQFATARSDIEDITFSGPGAMVDVIITMPFDIGFQRIWENWSGNGNFNAPSDTTQTFSFDFGGSNIQTFNTMSGIFVSGQESIDFSFTRANDPQFSYTFSKIFEVDTPLFFTDPSSGQVAAGLRISEDFFLAGAVTIHQQFPVGIPLFLEMDMSTSSRADALFVSSAFADTDGFHSFGIPTGVSAFNLPAGYTVDAPSIGLVNGVIPDSSAPEPASVTLFGTGCLAVLVLRRVRRKTR